MLAFALGVALASGAGFARHREAPEPALWQISGSQGTVYLFGSIHMLPRDWAWRTAAIDAAIKSSDVFVFETTFTPRQLEKVRAFIREHGKLPQGQRLSRKLSPQGLKDFRQALNLTALDPASVNAMRPWLALMVLGDYQIQNGPQRTFVEEGVDQALEREAEETGKPIRQLETAENQLAILLETTPDEDIAGFEADLRELLEADDKYRRLLEGWTSGKQNELAGVLAEEATRNPDEKLLLLDKRNRNWLPQIEAMMVSRQTTFITVGAAHLVGPGSVLEMLCVRGWNVQRVKTGPSAPPPGCPAYLKPKPTASLKSQQASLEP